MEINTINTMRYGLPGMDAINLYSINGAESLTLGQLIIALCAQSVLVNEARALMKMNVIANRTDKINRLAHYLEGIADKSISWDIFTGWGTYDELTNELGIAGLPLTTMSVDDRLRACKILKQQIENLSYVVQKDNIVLQTQASRRDIAMTTSSNIVGNLMGSMMKTANNLH